MIEGIIQNTMVGAVKTHHMNGLDRMLVQRTGMVANTPTMEGIIANTKHAIPDKHVPELHKVHHKGKTQATRMGQIPYAGPKY